MGAWGKRVGSKVGLAGVRAGSVDADRLIGEWVVGRCLLSVSQGGSQNFKVVQNIRFAFALNMLKTKMEHSFVSILQIIHRV